MLRLKGKSCYWINEYFIRGKNSDLILHCGWDGPLVIESNKILFALVSPVLREYLNEVPIGQTASVVLPDFDADTIERLIKLILNGVVELNETQYGLLFELMQLLSIDTDFLCAENNQTQETASENDNGMMIDNPDIKEEHYNLDEDIEVQNFNDLDYEDPFSNELETPELVDNNDSPIPFADSSNALNYQRRAVNPIGDINDTVQTDGEQLLYQCDQCVRCFSSVEFYQRHVTFTHPRNIGQFKCQLCDYSTSTRTALSRHALKHTGEKPYQCSHCSKSFGRKDHLKSHMRIHSVERNFQCPHCSKRFRAREHLKFHLQRHENLKAHVCSFCGKRYNNTSELRRHIAGKHKSSEGVV